MVSSINTNSASSGAAYHLAKAKASLSKSMARLSSGSRLVETDDDSAGTAVYFKTQSAVQRQDAVLRNLGNAMSWLQSQASALNAIGAQLARMSELYVLMRDVTKNDEDLDNYMAEFDELRKEMGQTMDEDFNGVDLLDLDNSKSDLQLYLNEGGTTSMTLKLTSFSWLDGASTGWETLLGAAPLFDGTAGVTDTAQGLLSVLWGSESFDNLFQDLASKLAANGAMQSRLGFAMDSVNTQRVAYEQAASRIGDTDVAVEVARLARSSILVESSSAMLAQANSTGRVLLKVMEG
jgi:flagellin